MQMTPIFRKIAYAAFAAGLTAAVEPGIAASTTDPRGTWLTEDGRARIRIERCGTTLEQVCGYIVWMKEPADARGQPVVDRQNPDLAKRSRPVLGHQLLMGLAPISDGRFAGQIYNAENGKSYAISLWRETPDMLKVKSRGQLRRNSNPASTEQAKAAYEETLPLPYGRSKGPQRLRLQCHCGETRWPASFPGYGRH